MLHEDLSVSAQCIQIWRFYLVLTIDPQLTETQIISQNVDNVGFSVFRKSSFTGCASTYRGHDVKSNNDMSWFQRTTILDII